MTRPLFAFRAARNYHLLGAGLLALVLAGRIARADYPNAAELESAASTSEESLRLLETHLANEQAKLVSLSRLRTRGQATWREVAGQRAIVDSTMAQRKGASEFSNFVAELRSRAALCNTVQESKSGFDNHGPTLRSLSLRVAATEAKANGELRAAEVALRREVLRHTALEKLRAGGHAGAQELSEASQKVIAAESVVERLATERADRIRTYDELLRASGQSLPSDCNATLASEEVRPELLPAQVFDHSSGPQRLLELRHARCATAARSESFAARHAMLEELVRRLDNVPHRSASLEREIESTRLDMEQVQAEEQAAKEQVALLRLKELRFVALCVEQPRSQELVTVATIGPFAAMPNPSNDDSQGPLQTDRRAWMSGTTRILPPRDRQAIAWPMPGQFTREVSGNSSRRTIRFSEPAYHDYYEFGIRRTDLPPSVRSTFTIGSIPWYLPGSPTNFR